MGLSIDLYYKESDNFPFVIRSKGYDILIYVIEGYDIFSHIIGLLIDSYYGWFDNFPFVIGLSHLNA